MFSAYVAKESFKSVHGNYYVIGQEISYLRYQLLAAVDKPRFELKRDIITPEEEYRREMGEGDNDALLIGTVMNDEAPVVAISEHPGFQGFGGGSGGGGGAGDEWTPDESMGHYHTAEMERGVKEEEDGPDYSKSEADSSPNSLSADSTSSDSGDQLDAEDDISADNNSSDNSMTSDTDDSTGMSDSGN